MQGFNQQSSSPGKTSSEYKNSSEREKKKKLGRSIEECSKDIDTREEFGHLEAARQVLFRFEDSCL